MTDKPMTDKELDEAAPKIELPQGLPNPIPPIEGRLDWKVGGNEFSQLIAEGLARGEAVLRGEDVPFVPAEQTITAEQAHPFQRDGVTPQPQPPGAGPPPSDLPPHDPAKVPPIAPPEALAAARPTPVQPPARPRQTRFQPAPPMRPAPKRR